MAIIPHRGMFIPHCGSTQRIIATAAACSRIEETTEYKV
jgi:hypothetical protein